MKGIDFCCRWKAAIVFEVSSQVSHRLLLSLPATLHLSQIGFASSRQCAHLTFHCTISPSPSISVQSVLMSSWVEAMVCTDGRGLDRSKESHYAVSCIQG